MINNLSKVFRYVNENGDSIEFTYDNGYIISKPDGIDTVSVNISEAQGINQTGTTIQSVNVNSRPVNVYGRLVGYFQSERKKELLSVIRPDLSARLYADDYYLDVRPSATPVIEPRANFASFQFSLLAAYPYWQKDESVTATLSGVSRGFKFPWNISRKYRFGEVVNAQFININNKGEIPVPFTVVFNALAEVSNPQLTDAKTGKYLLVNKDLIAGERLTIEITHERINAYSSVDGECRGAIDLRSSFNRLAVGDNVIKPDASSGKENLLVDMKYAIEIVGVAV